MYFTYLVTHVPSGRRYYGSRYSKDAEPSQLGVTYFTSSKIIKKLIADEGAGNFIFEVRKIFSSVQKCRNWEAKFLRRIQAASQDGWFNQCNGNGHFLCTSHSPETRQKMRRARLGYHHPEEVKLKIGLSQKGKVVKPQSPEQRRNTSLRQLGTKRSEETKLRMSVSRRKRVIPPSSQETKAKLSEVFRGDKNPFFGKHHNLDTRQRMSEARQRTPQQVCVHCGKTASPSMISRWHNSRCKKFISIYTFDGSIV